MSSLTNQMEQLKKQQEELEYKIKEENELNRVNGCTIEKLEMMVIDNRSDIQQAKNCLKVEHFTMCYYGSRFETILEILKVQDKKIKELQTTCTNFCQNRFQGSSPTEFFIPIFI